MGGGVTHGPRKDKNYLRKVNRKMRTNALYSVLSKKLADGEVLFVEALSVPSRKTHDAKLMLQKLSSVKGFSGLSEKKQNAALLALSSKDEGTERSLRNFSNLEVGEVRNLNPISLLSYKYLVIAEPQKALETLGGRVSRK